MAYSYIELRQISKAYNLLTLGVNTLEQLYILANIYMQMGKLEKYSLAAGFIARAESVWSYISDNYHIVAQRKLEDV